MYNRLQFVPDPAALSIVGLISGALVLGAYLGWRLGIGDRAVLDDVSRRLWRWEMLAGIKPDWPSEEL